MDGVVNGWVRYDAGRQSPTTLMPSPNQNSQHQKQTHNQARAEVARAVLQEWAYLQELRPQLAAGARALLHDPVRGCFLCLCGWLVGFGCRGVCVRVCSDSPCSCFHG